MNNTARVKINSAMLQLAREYRRFTQSEVADKVGITQPAYSKIEAGITQEILTSLLTDFSRELRFPESFFLQGDDITNIGSSALYNRGRKKITVAEMKWIEANINLYRWNIKKLLTGVTANNPRQLPGFNIEDEPSAASAAKKLRAYWSIPAGPIHNISALVENAGVMIIPVDFGTRHLDGTCLWLRDRKSVV